MKKKSYSAIEVAFGASQAPPGKEATTMMADGKLERSYALLFWSKKSCTLTVGYATA